MTRKSPSVSIFPPYHRGLHGPNPCRPAVRYREREWRSDLRGQSLLTSRRHDCGLVKLGMAKLDLGNGAFALVDDGDVERVSTRTWRLLKFPKSRTNYVGSYEYTPGSGSDHFTRTILLHRFLLNAGPGQTVDHKNGDALDNRRENLRFCSMSQNSVNWTRSRKKYPYRGLGQQTNGRWQVRVVVDGRKHYFGTYDTAEQAALVYDENAKRLHGEFAQLNFPDT